MNIFSGQKKLRHFSFVLLLTISLILTFHLLLTPTLRAADSVKETIQHFIQQNQSEQLNHYRTEKGNPLLIAVVMTNQKDLVDLLLQHQVDVNVKNKAGVTPLISAAGRGNADLVRKLIEAGANIDHQAKINGKVVSAISLATENNHQEVVKILQASQLKPVLKEGTICQQKEERAAPLSFLQQITQFKKDQSLKKVETSQLKKAAVVSKTEENASLSEFLIMKLKNKYQSQYQIEEEEEEENEEDNGVERVVQAPQQPIEIKKEFISIAPTESIAIEKSSKPVVIMNAASLLEQLQQKKKTINQEHMELKLQQLDQQVVHKSKNSGGPSLFSGMMSKIQVQDQGGAHENEEQEKED